MIEISLVYEGRWQTALAAAPEELEDQVMSWLDSLLTSLNGTVDEPSIVGEVLRACDHVNDIIDDVGRWQVAKPTERVQRAREALVRAHRTLWETMHNLVGEMHERTQNES